MAHGLDGWLVGLFLADHTALSTTFSSSSSLHIRRNSDFFYDGGSEFGWLAFAAGGPSKYLSLFLPITSGYCDSKNTSLRGSAGLPEKAPPTSVPQPSSERVLSPSGRKRRWTGVLSYRWVGRWGTISYLDKSFACKWKGRRKRRIRGGERPTKKRGRRSYT